ncbi:MAG: SH3 domain-containing protein [Anaerolineae bacterium]|nr:SH3 domain-containing protein [Anaerolineae bacterium]
MRCLTLQRASAALVATFLLALIPSPHAAPPADAQDPCDALVAPRLQAGVTSRVTSPYGLSLKNQPLTGAAGAAELALLPFGTVVSVLDGPRCNLGYVWWQVRLADGTTGWAAEGDAGSYFMAPHADTLLLFRPRDGGAALDIYTVARDGSAALRGTIPITPQPATPGAGWQQVEIDALSRALDAVRAQCPERLRDTPLAGAATLDEALALPLPPLEYDFYPAPSGERLVLVRHHHLLVPRCDTVIPQRIGMSTVSVLDATGAETVLFPFPQHGSVPASEDAYAPSEPDGWNVTLDEVIWSPHERSIAFVAAYRDACAGGPCYRFHLYIANLETGQLYLPGEGRHLGWTNSGEGIAFFRLVTGEAGQKQTHLFTARPDGTARQEVWLPGGAEYVSAERRDLGLPWNASGTRVLVANRGFDEVMLLTLSDRTFSPLLPVPDLMPQPNRLAVHLVRGESALLWTTIRGDFVLQNARNGRWERLSSELASTGIAPRRVQPFGTGDAALIEMADGSAYVLDLDADRLTAVALPADLTPARR